MRSDEFPNKEDKLFIPEKSGTQWLPKGVDDFFHLSEGYRMAAVTIFEEIKKREWVNKPFLACAMIFCFRQFIEVRLKELVYMGRKELFETPDFQKQHSLSNLFKDYINSVLPKLDPNYDKCMVDNVKCLIDEFNSIDPKSTSFRYPVEKKLKPTLNIPNLNLDNFKEVMDKLSNYFDAQLEIVKLLGNYNEEMATEYASYFYESY